MAPHPFLACLFTSADDEDGELSEALFVFDKDGCFSSIDVALVFVDEFCPCSILLEAPRPDVSAGLGEVGLLATG